MPNSILSMITKKYLLLIGNLLGGVIGLMLIFQGIRLIAVHTEFEIFLDTDHFRPAFILFGTGITVSLLSLVGGFGVAKENVVMVNVFGVFLISLFFLENFFVLYTFEERRVIVDDIKSRMTDVMENYNTLDYANNAWNSLQRELRCCGITHPSDWAPMDVVGCLEQEKGLNFTVPYSCTNSSMTCKNIYKRGCLDTLQGMFSKSYNLITFGLLSAFLVQLMGMLVIFAYARSIYRIRKRQLQIQQERQPLLQPIPVDRVEGLL